MLRVWSFVLVSFFLSTAALSQSGSKDVPTILSEEDINLYREIMVLQTAGSWLKADRLIKKLDDKILLGHIQFQRYMHPRKYRSRFAELSRWLKKYNDHPSAWRVYNLAMKRRGKARHPRRPAEMKYPGVKGLTAGVETKGTVRKKRSKTERTAIRKFKYNVRRYVRRGQPERAEKRFWAIYQTDLLNNDEISQALAKISASYYYEGLDEKANAIASFAVDQGSGKYATNNWIAGLSHYRLGHIKAAFDNFIAVSKSEGANDWLHAAGEFWAGRTAYQLGNPTVGERHLLQAAKLPETFYGMIATKQLGIEPDLDWSLPKLGKKSIRKLLRHDGARRAIALAEVGREDLADEELRLLWGREGADVQQEILALSAHMNLPAIQLRLGRAGLKDEDVPTSVRYPIPDWAPADGFQIDKAALFAIVRQESVFRSRARSRVGARGLMQVMPATARYLEKYNKTLRANRHRLSEPAFNMTLGQQYVNYLSDMDDVQGNLLMLLAAYNAGPGSLMKWHNQVEYGYDPLLFIESIGFYETRDFIEKVMSNLWMYRLKMGQPTPSLDALASGAWPPLERLDKPLSATAANTPSKSASGK